jgi:xylan 1,4-beta-xylosidase
MKPSLTFPKQFILATALAMAVTLRVNAEQGDAGRVRAITVDVNNVQGPLDTSFKECIGAGRANEGLRADWQDQLREAQRDCGFKYIRMHGLLTDDMGVYREDKQGNPIYNWQYIDRLYDFLLSIHIKPFVELSFMPNDLSSSNKTVFWWKGNVTPPKSYDKWSDLISHLVNHFQERYGHDEVASWYFEVWNEPDLRASFWTGGQKGYYHLYDVTARAIKSVSSDYRVGGPASAIGHWDRAFIDFCYTNHTPLDFISTHCYGVKTGYLDETGQRGVVIDADSNSIIGRMTGERKMIDQSPMPDLPLHFTEWNSSYTPTDFIHDTYQQAAFVLSKVKGSYHSVNSMSYWVFTDIFEENSPRMTPFHGGFGLINYEDLKKPAYYAFKFLNELGPQELANPDSASWVCKDKDNSVQALFWDFTPIVPPDGTNDQEFYHQEIPAKDIGHATLSITNLPAGSYSLQIYHTGYRANDVFTGYLDMGSPSQLTPAQVNILREASSGDPESVETIQVEAGKPFVREFHLRQNDVYFVKLLPLTAG